MYNKLLPKPQPLGQGGAPAAQPPADPQSSLVPTMSSKSSSGQGSSSSSSRTPQFPITQSRKSRVKGACQACQRKKRKCDGKAPICGPCLLEPNRTHEHCVYTKCLQERYDELNTEVTRLSSEVDRLQAENFQLGSMLQMQQPQMQMLGTPNSTQPQPTSQWPPPPYPPGMQHHQQQQQLMAGQQQLFQQQHWYGFQDQLMDGYMGNGVDGIDGAHGVDGVESLGGVGDKEAEDDGTFHGPGPPQWPHGP